jgi:hypothetical protein
MKMSNPSSTVAVEHNEAEIARSPAAKLVAHTFKFIRGTADSKSLPSNARKLLFGPVHNESLFISIDEAHEKFGITKEDLNKLCMNGTLEAKQVDGVWFISGQSLDKYITSR